MPATAVPLKPYQSTSTALSSANSSRSSKVQPKQRSPTKVTTPHRLPAKQRQKVLELAVVVRQNLPAYQFSKRKQMSLSQRQPAGFLGIDNSSTWVCVNCLNVSWEFHGHKVFFSTT